MLPIAFRGYVQSRSETLPDAVKVLKECWKKMLNIEKIVEWHVKVHGRIRKVLVIEYLCALIMIVGGSKDAIGLAKQTHTLQLKGSAIETVHEDGLFVFIQ